MIICINYVFKGGRYEGTKVKVKVLLLEPSIMRMGFGARVSCPGVIGAPAAGGRWLPMALAIAPSSRSWLQRRLLLTRGRLRTSLIIVPAWTRLVPPSSDLVLVAQRSDLVVAPCSDLVVAPCPDLLFLDPKLCYFLLNLNLLHTFLLNLSLFHGHEKLDLVDGDLFHGRPTQRSCISSASSTRV